MVMALEIISEIKGLPEPLIVHYNGFQRKLSLRGLKASKRRRGAYINLYELEWLIKSGKQVKVYYQPFGEDHTVKILRSILRRRYERVLQRSSIDEMMTLVKEKG